MNTAGKSAAAGHRTTVTSWKPSITATACGATPLRAIITATVRPMIWMSSGRTWRGTSRWRGRVTYANGDAQEFTDAEAFLECVREELPYRPTTGFRYEVLTDDPSVRKQVDDIVFDLYGEENPRQLEEYQKTPDQGMTMGGM